MGTPLGPKYIPYTHMDPLGKRCVKSMLAYAGLCMASRVRELFDQDVAWESLRRTVYGS